MYTSHIISIFFFKKGFNIIFILFSSSFKLSRIFIMTRLQILLINMGLLNSPKILLFVILIKPQRNPNTQQSIIQLLNNHNRQKHKKQILKHIIRILRNPLIKHMTKSHIKYRKITIQKLKNNLLINHITLISALILQILPNRRLCSRNLINSIQNNNRHPLHPSSNNFIHLPLILIGLLKLLNKQKSGDHPSHKNSQHRNRKNPHQQRLRLILMLIQIPRNIRKEIIPHKLRSHLLLLTSFHRVHQLQTSPPIVNFRALSLPIFHNNRVPNRHIKHPKRHKPMVPSKKNIKYS